MKKKLINFNMTFEVSEEDFEGEHMKLLINEFHNGEFAREMSESGKKHGIGNVVVKCEIYDVEDAV